MLRMILLAAFLAFAAVPAWTMKDEGDGGTDSHGEETPITLSNSAPSGSGPSPAASGAPSASYGTVAAPGGSAQSSPAGGGLYSAGYKAASPSGAPGVTNPDNDAGGVWRGTRETAAPEPAAAEPQEARQPMSLADTRYNFATVLETHIAARSPKGYWSYKDPATKKFLKLKLSRIDKSSIEKIEGTLYRGQAVLREKESTKTHAMEFTIDFAPLDWSVKSYRKIIPRTTP